MDISTISKKYKTRKLNTEDVKEIYELEAGNPYYFRFCPPEPSDRSILEDMKALPPKKTYDDKYYFGFFEGEKLIAVMDLICRYPKEDIAFIGFFMMRKEYQHKGIGSDIIDDTLCFLKEEGFSAVRLGYMKGNEQSKHFWMKNGFTPTGVETDNGQGTVVVMEKQI